MNAHFSFCLGQMERLEADIDAIRKVGDRGFEPYSALPSFKEQNISFPLTRKD